MVGVVHKDTPRVLLVARRDGFEKFDGNYRPNRKFEISEIENIRNLKSK